MNTIEHGDETVIQFTLKLERMIIHKRLDDVQCLISISKKNLDKLFRLSVNKTYNDERPSLMRALRNASKKPINAFMPMSRIVVGHFTIANVYLINLFTMR